MTKQLYNYIVIGVCITDQVLIIICVSTGLVNPLFNPYLLYIFHWRHDLQLLLSLVLYACYQQFSYKIMSCLCCTVCDQTLIKLVVVNSCLCGLSASYFIHFLVIGCHIFFSEMWNQTFCPVYSVLESC